MGAKQPIETSSKSIFFAALDVDDPAERTRFVDKSCSDDHALREEVEKLLSAHAGGENNLLVRAMEQMNSRLANGEAAADGTSDQLDAATHPVIDRYKVLEEIGHGGMGTVYMAQQLEPVKRRVALKVIKPGMDSREVISRFEAERQALALMDHPNIAHVFDGGTTERGRPYFVMELVRGLPITEFCQQGKLSLRDKMQLFVDVCQAVQHAHQKGIIHRDLKPSNVQITNHDGTPVAKVIDFGVAKALSGELTDKTLFTKFAQLVGTPLYMSPEQADPNGLDADTRSDIYSLGVLLYELLTGTTPFDRETLANAGFDGTRQLICEVDPPRPSQRLSTIEAAQGSTIKEQGQKPFKRQASALRGDLDSIVMKALEKDRNRRYQSANALAQDIERYLNNEPVEAKLPSLLQTTRKWSYRHRGLVRTFAITLAVAITIGGALLWRERSQTIAALVRETEQRELAQLNLHHSEENAQRANTEAETAIQMTEFLVSLFEGDEGDWMGFQLGTSRAQGENLTARVILDRGAERITRELNDRPLMQAKMMDTIGYIYRSQGMLREAEPLLEQALTIRRDHLGNEHLDVASSLDHIAWLRFDHGDYESSEALFREALAMRQSQLDTEHPLVADSMFNLAITLGFRHGNSPDSSDRPEILEMISLYRNSLAIRRKVYGNEHRDVASSLSILGMNLTQLGERQQAEPLIREAKRLFLKLEGENNPGMMTVHFAEAEIAKWSGDAEAAEPLYRRAAILARELLGRGHPMTVYFIRPLGFLIKSRNPQEAEELYREALAIQRKHLGDKHQDVARTMQDLGSTLSLQSKHQEAEQPYRQALAINRKHFGEESREVADSLYSLAKYSLSPSGKHDEAEVAYREALAIYRKRFGNDSDQVAGALHNLGSSLSWQHKFDEARTIYSELIELNPADAFSWRARGWAFCQQSKWPSAAADFAKSIELQSDSFVPWYWGALAQLAGGDIQGYRDMCTAMLKQFADTSAAQTAQFAAWSCLLGPDAVDDYALPIALAERAVEGTPQNVQYLNSLGGMLYRAEQFEEALARLEEADSLIQQPSHDTPSSPAYTWFFLAMTHHRLGHADEAQRWYQKAAAWTSEVLAPIEGDGAAKTSVPWNRRLTLELLQSETSELLATSAEAPASVTANTGEDHDP